MQPHKERQSRGHYCTDYCQPPEHSDLCYCGCEWDEVGNHLVFEADYWHLYRVVVVKVRRVPDLDNMQNDLGSTRSGQPIKQIPIQLGDTIANKAFEVRWRGDIPREPNRFRRLDAIRALYGKPFVRQEVARG